VRLALLIAFVFGFGYQVYELHASRKSNGQIPTQFASY
jgi:hypothetical protein